VEGINSYPLSDHLVLHDTNAERLHLLNPMARSIWQACDQGFQLSDIARMLAESHRMSMDAALATVRRTMETWLEPAPADTPQTASEETRAAHPPPARISRFYGYYDRTVSVNYSTSELESLIHPVFESMATSAASQSDHVFDVYQDESNFILACDRQEIGRTDSLEDIALDAIREITQLSYQSPPCLAILHAGVVASSDRAILIAGQGGSGKTTLAAALIKNGFVHISDDVAPILIANHEVFPIPMALCVKEGSWQALRAWYPELAEQRVYQRYGKQARFLSPGSSATQAPNRSYPVSHILFPNYRAGVSASLTPLAAAGIFQQMIEAGSVMGGGFDSVKVESLLAWIQSLRGYALEYDDLTDALDLIQQIDGIAASQS